MGSTRPGDPDPGHREADRRDRQRERHRPYPAHHLAPGPPPVELLERAVGVDVHRARGPFQPRAKLLVLAHSDPSGSVSPSPFLMPRRPRIRWARTVPGEMPRTSAASPASIPT